MAAVVRTYQNKERLGDTRIPTNRADTQVTETARVALNEETKAAEEILVKYDKTRSREAYASFEERSRDMMQELNQKEGTDALGKNSVMAKYQEWYDKELSDISDSLDNPDQQEAFKILADRKKGSSLDRLATKEATENKRYLIATHDAELTSVFGEMMVNPGDDGEYKMGVDRIKASFKETYPGINTSKQSENVIGELAATRIRLLADMTKEMSGEDREKEMKRVKKFLEKSKDELKGTYLVLKEELEQTNILGQAQNRVDDAFEKFKDPEKILDYIREATNSETRQKALSIGRARISDNQAIMAEKKHDAMLRVTGECLNVYKGKGSKQEFLDKAYTADDQLVQEKLIKLADYFYRPDSATATTTDYVKYREGLVAIDVARENGVPLDPVELSLNYEAHMKPSAFAQLLNYAGKGGNLQGLTRPKIEGTFKFFSGKTAEERPDASVKFWDYIVDQLEPGKNATQDDLNRWATQWFKQSGTEEDIFFDDEMTRLEAIKGNEFSSWTPDVIIPAPAKKRIRKHFRDNPEQGSVWINKYGSTNKAIEEFFKLEEKNKRKTSD